MMFWYLASPYSRYPGGMERAHFLACLGAGHLIDSGVPVFSPIAHSHPIAKFSGLDKTDHAVWLPSDEPIMKAAHGIIVLKLDGWADSYGVQQEMKWFASVGKPIVYMTPPEVPLDEIKEKMAYEHE